MPDVPFGHIANVTRFWYFYRQPANVCSSTNQRN